MGGSACAGLPRHHPGQPQAWRPSLPADSAVPGWNCAASCLGLSRLKIRFSPPLPPRWGAIERPAVSARVRVAALPTPRPEPAGRLVDLWVRAWRGCHGSGSEAKAQGKGGHGPTSARHRARVRPGHRAGHTARVARPASRAIGPVPESIPLSVGYLGAALAGPCCSSCCCSVAAACICTEHGTIAGLAASRWRPRVVKVSFTTAGPAPVAGTLPPCDSPAHPGPEQTGLVAAPTRRI